MKDLQKSAKAGSKHSRVTPLYNQPNARLPPASYQSFLKYRHIPGFVIAPFNDHYNTKTLNSFFDTQLSETNPQYTKDGILQDVSEAGSIAMRVLLDYVGKDDTKFSQKFEFDREFVSYYMHPKNIF